MLTFFFQEDLEASLPSSALSTATSQGKQTQGHARALRVLIEELDDIHRTRSQLVRRAQSLADVDDIRARILKVSSGFERFAQVEPAMFEDVLDEELSKYDKFLREIGEVKQKQDGILSDIQVQAISDDCFSGIHANDRIAMSCFCNPGGMILLSKNENMLYSRLIWRTTNIEKSPGI